MASMASPLASLAHGIPLDPMPPAVEARDPSVPHAPAFQVKLNEHEFSLALRNALRYFPVATHAVLAPEFAQKLALKLAPELAPRSNRYCIGNVLP